MAVAEMTETPIRDSATGRRRALEEHVLLIAPSFGWWRGYYQLPKQKTETTVDGKAVDKETVTTPRVRLLTEAYPKDTEGVPWKKRFQALDSRKSAIVERWSVPFPIQGVRIVPKKVAMAFLQEIDDLKGDLHTAVNEFIAQYDSVMDQIRINVDADLIDIARSRASFPKTREQMRSKFYIDVVPVEIAGSSNDGDVTPQVVGMEELETHHQLVRDATQRKVEEAIESMVEAPRRQLTDALAGLKDVINRNGKVSTKSFKPVYDAIKKIRAFEFACNNDLLDEIKKLEGRMSITVPRTLDSVTSASNGFTAALDGLLNEVDNEEKAAKDQLEFGDSRQLRAIELD
jgi:hypothetical protein